MICPSMCPSFDDGENKCPVCGYSYPEYIYTDESGSVVGCDECIKENDADDYFSQKGDHDRWDS